MIDIKAARATRPTMIAVSLRRAGMKDVLLYVDTYPTPDEGIDQAVKLAACSGVHPRRRDGSHAK